MMEQEKELRKDYSIMKAKMQQLMSLKQEKVRLQRLQTKHSAIAKVCSTRLIAIAQKEDALIQ